MDELIIRLEKCVHMIAAILIILLLLYILKQDKRKLGSLISPSFCFVLPTFIVAILYDLFGPRLGFYTIDRTIYLYILISSVFFILGRGFALKLKRTHIRLVNLNFQLPRLREVCISKKVYRIVFIVLTLLLIRLYLLGGVNVLWDVDLQNQYASNGFFGHIMVLAIFSIIILLSIHPLKYKKNQTIILLLGAFICVLFYQVKSWLIFPIIVSVLYKICIGVKQSYIKYAIAIISIVGCFILGYAFTYSLADEENQMFILNHFLKYLVAGVGGWSEALTDSYPIGQNPMYLLQPFSNIIGLDQARVDTRYSFIIINENGEYTNVFTLIGTAFLFAGPFFACLYFFVLGFTTYCFALYCMKNAKIGSILAYSILCCSLFLGFFGSYFTLLNIYELMFYALLLKYFIGTVGKSQNRIVESMKE